MFSIQSRITIWSTGSVFTRAGTLSAEDAIAAFERWVSQCFPTPLSAQKITPIYIHSHGEGMSTPSSHSPPHSWSWFTDPPYCMNVNSLPGYFWKVLGRSFERKIKVFCLRYSTLGISPSRHHEQQCTRLVFFCSAESSSIFSAGFANSSPPVLSCQTYKTKMSNLSFIPWKHQAPGLEHSSHFELKRMDSKWQLCLRGRRTCRRHRAKCGKERTELPCC